MSDILLTLHASLTEKQKRILRAKTNFMVIRGPAGTSKSYIALARGFKLLQKKEVDRIIIIRSAVETRKIGFLPGDQAEKLDVYADPYIHLIQELSPKRGYRQLVASKLLEFHSTSFLRGVTFDNAYIIVDEFQNMNEHELDTIVTRVGANTHMVVCGDSAQSDLLYGEGKEHVKVIRVLESMDEFETVVFTVDDIVRSEFVKAYYKAKEAKAAQKESASAAELPDFITRGSGAREEET